MRKYYCYKVLAFCWNEIKQGKLVPVLNGWSRTPWDLTVVVKKQTLSNRRLVSFARAIVEYESKVSEDRAKFHARELKKLMAKQETKSAN